MRWGLHRVPEAWYFSIKEGINKDSYIMYICHDTGGGGSLLLHELLMFRTQAFPIGLDYNVLYTLFLRICDSC